MAGRTLDGLRSGGLTEQQQRDWDLVELLGEFAGEFIAATPLLLLYLTGAVGPLPSSD